jgi:hypothetical protein
MQRLIADLDIAGDAFEVVAVRPQQDDVALRQDLPVLVPRRARLAVEQRVTVRERRTAWRSIRRGAPRWLLIP